MISMCSSPRKPQRKTESQRDRAFGLKEKGGVVQPQLLERVPQQRVLMRIHGVEPGKDHRLNVFEAGQRSRRRTGILGDRVADLGVGHILDGGGKEAHLAGRQLLNLQRLGRQDTHRFHIEYPAIGHEPDLHAPCAKCR
jgi:hypothetical protein